MLQWTGERMIADHTLGKGAIEHLHRYGIIQSFIDNKVVLDLASGEGYGSNIIAQNASFVYGVDVSPEAIEHANKKYKKENLSFLVGSATKIPLDDNSVDVVVSFETLEHLEHQDEMIAEFLRVMKPDAVLIISTPEKENYKKVDPNNPFHLRELTLSEFEQLLSKFFSNVRLYHQRFFDVSFVYPSAGPITTMCEFSGDFTQVSKSAFRSNHLFNIAICSNNQFFKAEMETSFFLAEEYWKKRQDETNRLNEIRIAEAVNLVRQSYSYRLGNFLLFPFSAIKRWVRA